MDFKVEPVPDRVYRQGKVNKWRPIVDAMVNLLDNSPSRNQWDALLPVMGIVIPLEQIPGESNSLKQGRALSGIRPLLPKDLKLHTRVGDGVMHLWISRSGGA